MKALILILSSLIGTLASAQTNTLTFTNNSGIVYSNVTVVKIESEGVLFRFSDWQYTRVKFTNMSASVQTQFGYDPEKIRKANEERLAEENAEAKAAQERQIAEAKVAQYDSIKKYKDDFFIYTFDESDFPKTEAARQACKEIVSELKGISKALEIGLNYNKFSDLLTDKVLSVEKIKDLRGEGIPRDFLRHADNCVDAFKESKHWWNEKIHAEFPQLENYDEHCMRDYWSEAELQLICCSGIAESNTNAITLAIDKMAEMIKAQQDAVKDGILKAKDNFDPNVYDLNVKEISARLKASLSVTNTP
ncbi:MAG: hypothetical protein ABSG80_12145 [Verrucomicrobiota bacterium]